MAYNKRNWKARQGTGLNFFSIDGATPVPIVNQPTTLTEAGDALSAGNLNDWEQRIADGFDSASGELADAVEELESEDTALKSAINANSNRIANLEQKAGDYSIVQYRGTNAVPTGKAKYGLVKSIVGKTRAWNNILQNGNMESSSGYSINIGSIAVSDNVMTLTGLGSSSYLTGASLDSVVGHKYLVCAEIKYVTGLPTDTPWLGEGGYYGEAFSISAFTVGQWCMVAGIYSKDGTSGNGNFQFYTRSVSSGEVQIRKVFIRDLTTILDDWNPSDITTANIPLMVQQIPDLLKWDAYDAGSLVDTVVEGVEASVPYDGWDNLMENGYISQGTGQNVGDDSNYKRSTNYVPVTPSTKYRMRYPSYGGVILYYGSDKTYLGSGSLAGSSYEFVTGNNVYYIRFWFNYWQTYNNDIYVSDFGTLMLSAPVTLKSAGSVAEVLDVQTGKKTRPIGSVAYDGSDSTGWEYIASYGTAYRFDCSALVGKIGGGTTNNLLAGGAVGTADTEACELHGGDGHLIIQILASKLNNTATVSALMTYFTSNNLIVNYQLATPLSDEQVCDPIPDNTIATEGSGTIETIQTQTPVIDNCLDVGYLAV